MEITHVQNKLDHRTDQTKADTAQKQQAANAGIATRFRIQQLQMYLNILDEISAKIGHNNQVIILWRIQFQFPLTTNDQGDDLSMSEERSPPVKCQTLYSKPVAYCSACRRIIQIGAEILTDGSDIEVRNVFVDNISLMENADSQLVSEDSTGKQAFVLLVEVIFEDKHSCTYWRITH